MPKSSRRSAPATGYLTVGNSSDWRNGERRPGERRPSSPIDPSPPLPGGSLRWNLPDSKWTLPESSEWSLDSDDTPTSDSISEVSEASSFDQNRLPTELQLYEASLRELIDEDGNRIRFRELYPESNSRTVVFFIRGLICGQCQDYMQASIARLDPDAIAAAQVRVVIISNGSWKGIKRYREMMKCPFPMFVDPTLELYRILGMNPRIGQLEQLVGHFKAPKDKPKYHQRMPLSQTVHGAANAARLGVLNVGSIKQLGGEFVLLPGYRCSYAHRMTNKFNHVLAVDVLHAAGVKHPELIDADEMDQFICTLESIIQPVSWSPGQGRSTVIEMPPE